MVRRSAHLVCGMNDTPDTAAQSETGPGQPNAQLRGHLNDSVGPAERLAQLAVPQREPVVGDWFRQADLGFIYGARGLGKTWLAMFLARKCAEGASFAHWLVLKPRRVLYVDGEMPLDTLRDRDAALSNQPADGMFYFEHDTFFRLSNQALNLSNPSARAILLEKCLQDRIEILFLDNLSCLLPGANGDGANDWAELFPWLMELRHHHIAVVCIAQAGRNGFMRGVSRREDSAFWIIQLTESTAPEAEKSASFVARFVKNRNTTDADCPPLTWSFSKPNGEPKAKVSWDKPSIPDLFRQCIEDKFDSATEIAHELGISKVKVSRLATAAINEGWLQKKGRKYVKRYVYPPKRFTNLKKSPPKSS